MKQTANMSRQQMLARMNELADAAEQRTLTDAERGEFDRLRRQIKELDAAEQRQRFIKDAGQPANGGPRVTAEPATYREDQPGVSFFRDMAAAKVNDDPVARERLNRHRAETRDLSMGSATAGGHIVSPAYLNELFVDASRSAAPVLSIVPEMELPKTDQVNVPSLTSGAAVAIQASEGSAIQDTDAVFGNTAMTVYSYAGKNDVSEQLLAHSVPGVDEIIMRDLADRLAILQANHILQGTGSSQPTGIANTASVGSVTYTDATPTLPELFAAIAEAYNDVAVGAMRKPSHIVMHPRRWSWMLSQRDSTGRPLLSAGNGAQNPMGVAQPNDGNTEGVVGNLLGVPVVVDSSVTTTANTSQDRIYVGHFGPGSILRFASAPQFAMSNSDQDNFTDLRISLRAVQMACSGVVKPAAFSVISGTGISTPAFS